MPFEYDQAASWLQTPDAMILYNQNSAARAFGHSDYVVIDRHGNEIVPKGRYDYLYTEYPYSPILCYMTDGKDELNRLVAVYSWGGQKLMAADSLLGQPGGDNKPLLAADGNTILPMGAFKNVLPLSTNDDHAYNTKYAVRQGDKYALLTLNDYYSQPSAWAQSTVEQALAADIIPHELAVSYKNACTREDFCIYLANAIEKATGQSLADIIREQGAELKTFSDCNRDEVAAAHTLNLVAGTGNGKFTPDGLITREQAAVLLMQAAAFLDIQTVGTPMTFSDYEAFSAYAVDAIAFVSSDGQNGAKIMSGVGNNRFDPKGLFTREQTIVTLLNLCR